MVRVSGATEPEGRRTRRAVGSVCATRWRCGSSDKGCRAFPREVCLVSGPYVEPEDAEDSNLWPRL